MIDPSDVSIILSTYNSPEVLQKTLWGYWAQSCKGFEIVVADDGSSEATGEVIRAFGDETGTRMQHVWHEDAGFRKSEILNKSVTRSAGRYLIVSDADCIPRKDFVFAHASLACQGTFLSGGRVKLPESLGQAIDRDTVLSGRALDTRWLVARGTPRTHKLLKLWARGAASRLCDALTTTRPTWNGHNSSCWKDDLLRVNGFDERMQYGGLDREFGERLMNDGIRPRQIRHRAVCVHVEHARPYKTCASLERNKEIRKQTRGQELTWTPFGIFQERRRQAAADPLSRASL